MEHPRPAPTGAPQGTDVKPTAPQKTIIERLHDAVPVLLPDSKLRNYWDALMFVVIFYNCNLTPVSITAPPASDIFRRLRRVDFAIDLLFLVDTLLGFCCAFHDPHTKELVTQRKGIRDAYLQSARLKLNLLAVSPLLTLPNPLSSLFGGGACKLLFKGSATRISRKTCLKAARLTRSSRIFLFFAQLEAVRKILEDQKLLVMNGAAFRMLQIIVSLIFMCSFCGGFYFFLACNDPSPDKRPKCGYGTSTSWVGADAVFQSGRTSWDAIIARAFHFCVQTLFTIGYGDSVAPVSEVELKFAVALMLAGAVVYALVIANMTSVLANANVLYARHVDELAAVTQVLDDRDLPEGLRQRIKLEFEYVWAKQFGVPDRHLLRGLPAALRDELAAPVVDHLTKVPFFDPNHRNGSDALARAVARGCKIRVYVPRSTIFAARERQRELVIVRAGAAYVFRDGRRRPSAVLREGDFVGDVQFLFDARHPVSVRTGAQVCEVFVWTPDVLGDEVIREDAAPVKATLEAYQRRLEAWSRGRVDEASLQHARPTLVQQAPSTKRRYQIGTYDHIRGAWEPCLFAAVFFSFLMVPLRSVLYCTDWRSRAFDPTLVIEYALDVVFLVDMYLRLYHMEAPEVYKNSVRFKVDVVANVPYIILAPLLNHPQRYAMLRYPHLLRGFNLKTYLVHIRDYLEVKHHIMIRDKTITIFQRTYETVFLIHGMACFWAILKSHGSDGRTFASSYVRSVYYALVMSTTVGYGDVAPTTVSETWFAVVAGAAGATCFAGVVANITSFVHSVDISEDNLAHKRCVLKTFCEERNLSPALKDDVKQYLDYMEHEKGGLDDLKLINQSLSDHTRDDVALYMAHRPILACPVFRGLEGGFIRRITLELVSHFYSRGTQVVRQNQGSDGAFFIACGDVDISIDDDTIAALASPGCVAEGALLADSNMPYAATCASYCELWFLSRLRFDATLESYPDARAEIAKTLPKRVKTYKKRSKRTISRPTGLVVNPVVVSRVAQSRLPRGVVHPDRIFMKAWAFLLLFFVVWNVFWVPFRACFTQGVAFDANLVGLFVVDYVGDVVFLTDIVLRSCCVAFYEGDALITRRRRIWENYASFPRHVIASLPFDFLYFISGKSPLRTLALWRLPKLVRLVDAPALSKRCEDILQESGVRVNKNVVRLGRLVGAVVVTAHLFGSAFYALASFQSDACARYASNDADVYCRTWAMAHPFDQQGFWPPNLLDVRWRSHITFENPLRLNTSTPIAFGAWGARRPHELGLTDTIIRRRYVNALYWGCATITTVGYGDVAPSSLYEVGFAIACIVVAVVVYTLVIANLEDIVANLDVTSTLYALKREKVKQWCLRSSLPGKLSTQVADYYDKLWAQQKGVKGTAVLAMLPENLRSRVALELCGDALRSIPCCRGRALEDLALKLRLDLYAPESYLFRAGECAERLFVVAAGGVALEDDDGAVLHTIERGLVGEAEFLLRRIHEVACISTDYAQIFDLSYGDLVKVLRFHKKWDEFRAYCVAHENTISGKSVGDDRGIRATDFHVRSAEKRRSRDASGSCVAHPASRFKRLWVVACLGLSLYSLVSAPFGVGFARRYSRTTCAMDAILFVFFSIDLGLNLAVFAVKRQGKVILERRVFRDLYVRTDFVYDLVSLLPLSLLVALSTPDVFAKRAYDPTIHALRLVQALRARRVPAYVDSMGAYLEERWQLNLSGDMTYLILLCASVLLMCHWLACALAYLARYELWRAKASDQFAFWSLGNSKHDRAWRWYADEGLGCREYGREKRKHAANVWVCEAYPPNPALRIADASMYDRWLVAFYWAVYTCSTVGFGGVSLNSNAEKLLACLGMVLGAVVCDAGIAAVLTAVVEHKDHQHGTNRRRRECGRRMMAAARVPMEARMRVAAYFEYVDDDLHNLDDATVLDELNVALRRGILRHAAHAKLCDSLVHGGLEAGVVASMVHDMRPVVAAPGERILEAGQPDPAAYVFAAGRAHAVDDRGHEEYLSVGAILSNNEFRQVAKRVGVPTRRVTFHIERCRGLPPQASLLSRAAGASACDPFVEVTVVSKTVFGQSVKTCRTRVRRFSTDPLYDETFSLKAYHQTRTALVTVYNWARGVEGRRLGQVEVEVQEPRNRRPRWHRLRDARGRRVGDVRLRVACDPLGEAEVSKTAEVTVVADGFCHLYELSFEAQANVKRYIRGLRLTLAKRLETLDDAPAVDWRPAAGALDALAPDPDLRPGGAPARGFEAYASEAFARRPSPVGLPSSRRNSFGDRATTRAPSVSFDHRRSRHSSAQSLRRQSSRLHHAGRVSPVS